MAVLVRNNIGGGIDSLFTKKRKVVYATNEHNPNNITISDSRVTKSGNTSTLTATADTIIEVTVFGLSRNGGSATVTSTGTELFRQEVGSAMGYWGGGAINAVFKLTAGQKIVIYMQENVSGGDHTHGGGIIIYEY